MFNTEQWPYHYIIANLQWFSKNQEMLTNINFDQRKVVKICILELSGMSLKSQVKKTLPLAQIALGNEDVE